MRIRKIFTSTVGMIQSIIAVLTLGFACLIYFDLFNIQATFNIPAESVSLSLFTFLGFGLFLLVSGLFLIGEGFETR
ncbi:MAG: hypothetical protein PVH12_01250 [Candidatus Bathyarchaeota archaeon]|jgi:hypothetical protein